MRTYSVTIQFTRQCSFQYCNLVTECSLQWELVIVERHSTSINQRRKGGHAHTLRTVCLRFTYDTPTLNCMPSVHSLHTHFELYAFGSLITHSLWTVCPRFTHDTHTLNCIPSVHSLHTHFELYTLGSLMTHTLWTVCPRFTHDTHTLNCMPSVHSWHTHFGYWGTYCSPTHKCTVSIPCENTMTYRAPHKNSQPCISTRYADIE